ncbi:MAG: SDR family oxidoreductase [Candidatus Yonathbacteria bacterium]|nr:SDR family oxidoreductase [Candidatus Yonathbacteria bacterium]
MKTLKQLMDLKGRVALITGGAGHIGSAIAEALAELGANIVLLDISEAQSNEIAVRLTKEYGIDALVLTVDLGNDEQIRAVPAQIIKKFGRFDILVNNAALVGTSDFKGWEVPFKEQSSETWRKALEINLTAAFVLTQACAEALEKSGHGSVINIGSIYGMVGPDWGLYEGTTLGNPAAYAASKGGLLQLMRWLATTLAPRVRVNMITLGGILRGHTDPFLSRYNARTPMQRMGSEEDVKGAVAYLASDASAYVTGQNIVVDGGWTAR